MPPESENDQSGYNQSTDSWSPKDGVPVSRNASMKYWSGPYELHNVYGNPDPSKLPAGIRQDISEEQMSIISESSVDPRRRSRRNLRGFMSRILSRRLRTDESETTNIASQTPVVPITSPGMKEIYCLCQINQYSEPTTIFLHYYIRKIILLY